MRHYFKKYHLGETKHVGVRRDMHPLCTIWMSSGAGIG